MGALWAFPSRNSDLARSTPPRKRQSKTGTTGSQWAITTEPRSTQRGSLTAYAIAWSFVSSLDKDGHLAVPELLYGVVAFFEIQLVLAILGTNVVFTALKKQEARAQDLLAHFAKQFPM